MATAIGVHFGNTSACVAVSKSGKVDVVANSHGERLTPARVTLLPEETLVGFASKHTSHKHVKETIEHVASVLGKRIEDVKHLADSENGVGSNVIEGDGGVLEYNLNGRMEKPSCEHIARLILKNVLETAQSQAGVDANEAVFTLPVGSSSTYRDALIDAASSVGFEVLRVISEHAAAALAYGIANEEQEQSHFKVIVFRVGGVSEDVSLLEICNGIIAIRKYVSRRYGGNVLTDDIAGYFASLFEREYRTSVSESAKAMYKLKAQAEICKHVLSTMPSASCHIDSLHDGLDFNGNISRSRFEMLVSDHLQALISPLKELLSNSDGDFSNVTIQKVIMCGGTCNIPRLQDMVSQLLPDAEILCSIPPSEVIAVGAAIEAGLLINTNDTDLAAEDCDFLASPADIYIHCWNTSELVFKRNTFLPCSFDKDYVVPMDVKDHAAQVMFRLQSEEKRDSLVHLADVNMENLTPGKIVNIQFKYLAHGHLVFIYTDKESGHSRSLTIGS